ncbi:hypothetical protein LPJ56_005900 [Coemansia sp. RSA 2599]|nr:hypothetical protein LPJ56_005900 [Coemansia sp. RSA 2599]
MTSETTGNRVELDCLADVFEPNGSLFKFQLPSLLEEWTVVFSLAFDPLYTVADFVSLPVSRPVDTVHIDILDSLQPCPDTDMLAQDDFGAVADIPHVCELWIKPESMSTSELSDLAPKLLLALLFEKTSPLNAHQTISSVMISPTAAVFHIPGRDLGNSGYVSAMCLCEGDHLALRLCSSRKDVYLGVLVATIKRLCLLFDLDLEDKIGRTSRDLSDALNTRTQDLVRVLQNTDKSPSALSSDSERRSDMYSDFVFIECKSQSTLFQYTTATMPI